MTEQWEVGTEHGTIGHPSESAAIFIDTNLCGLKFLWIGCLKTFTKKSVQFDIRKPTHPQLHGLVQ